MEALQKEGPALSTDGLQVGLSGIPRDALARKPLVDLDFFFGEELRANFIR